MNRCQNIDLPYGEMSWHPLIKEGQLSHKYAFLRASGATLLCLGASLKRVNRAIILENVLVPPCSILLSWQSETITYNQKVDLQIMTTPTMKRRTKTTALHLGLDNTEFATRTISRVFVKPGLPILAYPIWPTPLAHPTNLPFSGMMHLPGTVSLFQRLE